MATRARRTTSFTWYGDADTALRGQTPEWPDEAKASCYESDVGERQFRKVSYDSDSCLTPRSRRTLRRTLSSADEPTPPAKPALDTIFSPTHEILHPMQSLRLERSLSQRAGSTTPARAVGRSGRVIGTRVAPERFTPESTPAALSSLVESIDKTLEMVQKPRFTPVKFESYSFPEPRRSSVELEPMDFKSYRFAERTLEEEDREQKQSLIRSNSEKDEATKTALAPNVVVIIVDAEKKLTFVALDWAINVAVRPGDEIVVLGVLKHILSPMGYKILANTDPLYGVDREVLQLEVKRVTETFQSKLSDKVEECEKKKVKLTVRVAPGARVRTVVVRELEALGATYAIFDRKAMRSRRYYGKHLTCHAVRMRRNGRSTKTISLTPPPKTGSDISSISCASSESASPTLWRRITSFRSNRRSRSLSLDAISPDAFHMFPAAPKTCVSADAFSSRRKSLPAMSITIPPPICAA